MVAMFTCAAGMLVTLLIVFAIEIRRRRMEARRFHWQFGIYQGGRLVHAVPIDDVDHVEDNANDCMCSPWSERFERGDGSYGDVIYHQRVRR